MRLIKYLIFAPILALALTVFSSDAFAQVPSTGGAKMEGFMNQILHRPYNSEDLAHKSLVRLFGGFIFEPFGNAPSNESVPPTALARVLGYTNVVAMILGVIIMAYVVVAGAINTAASGEMLGRSWSSAWLPLRTSVAFGMIMPASSGGEVFSVAQSLVIWMIIVGSNSATWVWEQGLESLKTGSPVMQAGVYYTDSAYSNIASVMYCAYTRNKLLEQWDGETPIAGVIREGSFSGTTFLYEDIISDTAGTSYQNATSIEFNDCGEINLPNPGAYNSYGMGSSGYSAVSGAMAREGSFEQVMEKTFREQVVSNIPPVLKASHDFAHYMHTKELNDKKITAAEISRGGDWIEMNKKIDDAAAEYHRISKSFDTFVNTVRSNTIPKTIQDEWSERIKKGGWMRAGVWFFEASRMQGFVQSLMAKVGEMAVIEKKSELAKDCAWYQFGGNCGNRVEDYRSWINALEKVRLRADDLKQATPGENTKLSITQPKQELDGESFKPDVTKSIAVVLTQTFLNGLVWLGEDDTHQDNGGGASGTGGIGSNSVSEASGLISPFTTISSIGRGLQQISITVWSAGLAASYFIGSAEGAANSAPFFSGAFIGGIAGVGKYLLATLTPVLAGIGALSFVLTYALPFMPITIWIMLVCGYLVTTIEAVAAAPLAVIMLATPEGEGMSGSNFQRALQMINAIILRPTLSIVGLFAAMTLSFVGFALLNELFWSVANMLTGMRLFDVMALIFIYTSVAYKVTEYMVFVIHKIPDQIMEWMGGGMNREFGESTASHEIGSQLTRHAAAGGMAAGAGLSSLAGIAANRSASPNGPGGGGGGRGGEKPEKIVEKGAKGDRGGIGATGATGSKGDKGGPGW